MESFSLTLALGWNRLSTLLSAKSNFGGKFSMTDFFILNTHAVSTLTISHGGATAPAANEGLHLTASGGTKPSHGWTGTVNAEQVWINASAIGSCDVTFIRYAGI